MPAIKDRLQEDWKHALKSKEKFRANVISTARSSILLVEKTSGMELEDDKVIEILAREVKQRKEAMLEFKKGNRQDLVDQSQAEIEILVSYLPQQLNEKEILEIIKISATQVGANNIKDMGKVMASVKPEIIGRADGKLVSQLVKEYLTNK